MHHKKSYKPIRKRKISIRAPLNSILSHPFYFTLPSTCKARIRCREDLINNKRRNLMEHINRIEIQGRVGTVRTNIVNETMVANFSVATDYLYKSKDGAGVSETTWHNVVAWANKDMPDLRRITKGTPVYISGRVRTSKYTTSEGVEKQFNEILANKLRILGDEIIEL